MKREFRMIANAEMRAQSDGKGIAGYAAVFNVLSEYLGWFREKIRPGAFSRCLQGDPDVRCLFNHDSSIVLGRTKSETLRLVEDGKGLLFNCDLPETQAARDLRELIQRGDVDQCSFGFIVNEQVWSEKKLENGDVETTRELLDVELFDVSPVTFPAYPQTSVEARDLWPDGEPEEVQVRRPVAASEAKMKVANLPDLDVETARRRVYLAKL